MAAILPFPARHSGDWTDSERARLDELAARLADQAGVEVAFGRSDSGDPWCVVLDASDEVLVHVARVQGDVVVHAAAPDVLVRAPDLRTAVDRMLGSRWLEERADVVVPLASGNRAMQVVTAVLIVGSFIEHHRAEAEPADDWIFAPTRLPKPLARDGQRDDAAKVALAADSGPGIEAVAELAATASRGGETGQPFGTSFDRPALGPDIAAPGRDLATSLIAEPVAAAGPSADVIVGTAGDDQLDGGRAPPGRHDLLDGGAGDDRLMLDGGTIAIGGDGSDRFMLRAPEVSTAGELTLLGIVVDFQAGVDVLTGSVAPTFSIVASVATRNIFADPNVNLGALPELPGQQLFADLDGNGRADGYVLVNSAEPSPALLDAVRQAVAPAAEPPTLVGAPAAEPAVAPPPVPFASEPMAEPTAPTTPVEPVAAPAVAEPPAQSVAEPLAEPRVPEPTVEPSTERAADPPVPEPKVQPATDRTAQFSIGEAKVEPTADREAESVPEPKIEPSIDQAAKPAAPGPNAETTDVRVAELSIEEAKVEPTDERSAEPSVPEPKAEPSDETALSVAVVESVGDSIILVSSFEPPAEPMLLGPTIEVI